MTTLSERTEELRRSGRKALVIYLVGGLDEQWCDVARAAVHAGADLLEIGLPFSDPIIDGPVIQRGTTAAIERGATVDSILADVSRLDVGVPLVAMTYFNLFHHRGLSRSADDLAGAGITGTIVPDLSLEELSPWQRECRRVGISHINIVAPSTPVDRVRELCSNSDGFIYAAARMAVTGVSTGLGDSIGVVQSIRSVSRIPVYLGIGISGPEQAIEASSFADGVIVGSAIVERVLRGEGPTGIEEFVHRLRQALDSVE